MSPISAPEENHFLMDCGTYSPIKDLFNLHEPNLTDNLNIHSFCLYLKQGNKRKKQSKKTHVTRHCVVLFFLCCCLYFVLFLLSLNTIFTVDRNNTIMFYGVSISTYAAGPDLMPIFYIRYNQNAVQGGLSRILICAGFPNVLINITDKIVRFLGCTTAQCNGIFHLFFGPIDLWEVGPI